MHISLLVDVRAESRATPMAQVFLRTTARQCAELFSIHRLAGGDRRTTVSLALATANGVTTVLQRVPMSEGDRGLQRLLRALESLERREPDGPTAITAASSAFSGGADRMSGVQPFFLSQGCALNDHATRGSSADETVDLLLFATSYVPYTDLFSSLANVGSAALPCTLHCVTVDAEAVGVATASLGTNGTLHCCSADPADLRAALQSSLLGALSRRPCDCQTAGPQASLVTVWLGPGASLACVAQRPYLAPPLRCCTADAFPSVQEEKPSLVVQGSRGGVRLMHSGFEVGRFGEEEGAATTLTLEGVLAPENVDETFLCDNTWVLTADATEASATLFSAAFAQFSADVLLLRCGTGGSNLAPTHHMALKSTCYIAYFVDRGSLVLRQVTPLELRRASVPPPMARPSQAHANANARLQAIRAQLVERSNGETFSLDNLLHGGLCLVAAQLQPEKEYAMQLVKLFR